MTSAKPTALITGASAGIGAALAQVFAERGYDLIVCARREDKLAELAESLKPHAQVDYVVVDLAKAKGPSKLFEAVTALNKPVDVLVNNAGLAYQGSFEDMSARKTQDMLALNIRSLTEITQLFLPQMLERQRGKILNVGSVVGFQAVPGMALYSATKAFVLSFTESLAEEVRCQGVQVSALCPGLTRTEMVSDLGTDAIPGAELMMADPREVAIAGYQAIHQGEVIRVPGMFNQAVVNWAEFQPRWLKRTLAGIAGRATFTAR